MTVTIERQKTMSSMTRSDKFKILINWEKSESILISYDNNMLCVAYCEGEFVAYKNYIKNITMMQGFKIAKNFIKIKKKETR